MPERMLDTRPGHVDPDSEAVRRVVDALACLPAPAQDAVRLELASVLVNFEATRQVDPVIHFMESLLMTARLHVNPAYQKGLKAAEVAAGKAVQPEGGDVADFVAAMHARRSEQ